MKEVMDFLERQKAAYSGLVGMLLSFWVNSDFQFDKEGKRVCIRGGR